MPAVDSSPIPRSVPDPSLVKVLRRLREGRGLSQEQLAHAANLTTSSFNRLEAGATSPGWMTVRAIAKALDVSMVELSAQVEAEDRS